jgi:hypothetical protein
VFGGGVSQRTAGLPLRVRLPAKPALSSRPPTSPIANSRSQRTFQHKNTARMSDDTTQHHRRIALDSPHDLAHISLLLRTSAFQKLTSHLPPSDPLRARVEPVVDDYITSLLALARHSISINGQPAAEVEKDEDEFEPFDPALQAKVQKVHEEIERRTLMLGELRRDVPEQMEREWRERLERERERDEKLIEGILGEPDEDMGIKEIEVERVAETSATRERAVNGLEGLREGLPAVGSKVQRAGEAVEFVLRKRGVE